MRLINVKTLQLEEFIGSSTPSYAILSHTWGNEEVSLQDFQQQDAITQATAGISKIKHTCDQAHKRGLQYAWIDTCCIDKTSSAELSEAINSMFRWYEEAQVCFAYLADVPPNRNDRDALFRKSRWFTRGWTLQELLAPHRLDFFASDWTFIANRTEMASLVREIRNIDEHYLTESLAFHRRLPRLAKASIAEIMSWAARRTTARTEDIAYSLLGLFGVSMPLIYGEGMKAFTRLQLEILQNSFDPTILAWHAAYPGQSLISHATEQCSSWKSAYRMLVGIGDPWHSSLQPPADGPAIGVLAPTPEYFSGCKDIVPCEMALKWTVTSRELTITLPISQNEQQGEEPYAVLPCRLRHDPWILLSVPLKAHGDNVYSRSHVPLGTVTHETWHHWPQSRLTFRLNATSDPAASTKIYYNLWVRSMPPTMKLLEVYFANAWTPGGRLISIESTPGNGPFPDNHGQAALLMGVEGTIETFAIVITPIDSILMLLSRHLSRPVGMPTSLDFRYVKPLSRDRVLPYLRSGIELNSMPEHLELGGRLIRTRVTRKCLLDSTVLELDIEQSADLSFFRRITYSTYKTLVPSGLTLSNTFMVTSWLVMVYLTSSDSFDDLPGGVFLAKLWYASPLTAKHICRLGHTMVFTNSMVPCISRLAIGSSTFLKKNRLVMATILGISMLITDSISQNHYLGTFVFFWFLCGSWARDTGYSDLFFDVLFHLLIFFRT